MTNPTRLASCQTRQLLICRGDQVTIAGLGLVALVSLSVCTLCWSELLGTGIDLDHAERLEVNFQVDLNRADWPELTLLPGIGPALAQRIVISRKNEGRFAHANELMRVKGIGPGRLARVRPYLVDWMRRAQRSDRVVAE